MGKRGAANGEGSIRFDKARRRWVVDVTIGRNADGKLVRERQRFVGHEEAKVWRKARLGELERQRSLGVVPVELPRVGTVGEWLEWWLENGLGQLAVGTSENYRTWVRLYVAPAVGHLRLAELQPAHVDAMTRALVERGLSTRTARHAKVCLGKALQRALREGLVARNVAYLADGVRIIDTEGRTLTPIEARRLLVELPKRRYGTALLVQLTAGLRSGEALGLRWQDYDPTKRTLRVSGAMKWLGSAPYRDEPKTRQSKRTVVLTPATAAALDAWRHRQADERAHAADEWATDWDSTDLIFRNEFGRPVDRHNLSRSLALSTAAAKLGKWHPHELRHSCASLLLAQGVPLKVVSEALGHSSIRVTADIYAHLLDEQRTLVADAMEAVLNAG